MWAGENTNNVHNNCMNKNNQTRLGVISGPKQCNYRDVCAAKAVRRRRRRSSPLSLLHYIHGSRQVCVGTEISITQAT